ncbi:MAG TPA: hypothetical protein VFH09_01560, partial [Nitrososphaera sp.]|nr:hypothetical protein [Nitrososphaera sp.]
MSNIGDKTIAAALSSTIVASILLILLIALVASSSGLDAPAFSQEESNIDGGALVLSGRISSILMPTMADTNNDPAMSNSAIMQQTINNNTSATAAQAMQFSVARDIAWLLSGDWVLAANANDSSSSSTTIDAEFIKVTTNGTMLHTHRITNFVPLTNVSSIVAGFD